MRLPRSLCGLAMTYAFILTQILILLRQGRAELSYFADFVGRTTDCSYTSQSSLKGEGNYFSGDSANVGKVRSNSITCYPGEFYSDLLNVCRNRPFPLFRHHGLVCPDLVLVLERERYVVQAFEECLLLERVYVESRLPSVFSGYGL